MKSEDRVSLKDMDQCDEVLLFEKGKRGAIRMLFGRTGFVTLLLLAQFLVMWNLFQFVQELIPLTVGAVTLFSFVMVVYVINSEHDASVKMTWCIMVVGLPLFGGVLYILMQGDIGYRRVKQRMALVFEESEKDFIQGDHLMSQLKVENKGLYNLVSYANTAGGFPIYQHSKVTYFPLGDQAFEAMLEELSRAEKYIFMEYFIIDEGYMWGRILKILSEKAKEGVEVRVMYDGTCEFALLPYSYPKKLKELGIQCKIFSRLSFVPSIYYNYRDHRKITLIDGRVAFNGGINLADEYINKKVLYGHWKDTAVMVEGHAVESFTIMFMQMWNSDLAQDDRIYMSEFYRTLPLIGHSKGYVLPFGDSPLDKDKVGELIYMDILNRAESYVHIMTPYLILDGEMLTSIKYAARRGIDVKIIMPHIPDKKTIFAQSRNHYRELIKAGVEIYEYTPGFMHAKVFVSDDIKAVVGTINLDYRSLYHHYECGTYMEDVPVVEEIEADVQKTLEMCQRVTPQVIKKYNIVLTVIGKVLKLIAPLL